MNQPDVRAAAGLGDGEAAAEERGGRIAMVFRRQQGDFWAPGSPVGHGLEMNVEEDIEGVRVELVREEVEAGGDIVHGEAVEEADLGT